MCKHWIFILSYNQICRARTFFAVFFLEFSEISETDEEQKKKSRVKKKQSKAFRE